MNIRERIQSTYLLKNYFPEDGSLKLRYSGTLFLTGGILSTVGFILGIASSMPFVLNLPNLIVMLLCFTLPIVSAKKKTLAPAIFTVYFTAYLYFPFIYFSNNGFNGSAPYYFFMMFLYFSFYFEGRRLFINIALLLIFYGLVIGFSFVHPELVVPYPDDLTQVIDELVGFISMAIVISAGASMAYKGYAMERELAQQRADDLAEKNRQLNQALITDHLTHTFSRQYFFEQYEKEYELSQRRGVPFSVMMIDIDFFKKVNDSYGHLAGDEILIMVAKAIRTSIGMHDIVARYGGEEFIVLFSHRSSDSASITAERIRANIAGLSYRDIGGVTVSIGVSTNRKDLTKDDLIEEADNLMYEAKRQGRNRVVSA